MNAFPLFGGTVVLRKKRQLLSTYRLQQPIRMSVLCGKDNFASKLEFNNETGLDEGAKGAFTVH